MIVFLNEWKGDEEGFSNNTTCDFCGKLSSVVVLRPMYTGYLDRSYICGHCLGNAIDALNKAILNEAQHG